VRVAGIVLCGGRSSRMGTPKAWLPFGDELMLPRVVRIVREAVGLVVVVAAPGQDVPPLPADVRIVRDEVEGRGPLGGLAAGLAALEGEADVVYLSSCDVPLLRPEFVRRVVGSLSWPSPLSGEGGRASRPGEGALSDSKKARQTRGAEVSPLTRLEDSPPSLARGEGQEAAVPRIGGRLHPLASAFRLSVLPAVRESLAANRLRMLDLFDALPTRFIGAAELADIDPQFRSLHNINTPEEYATALRELGTL
jgi:molybdenum cofactor guanylyltransferase